MMGTVPVPSCGQSPPPWRSPAALQAEVPSALLLPGRHTSWLNHSLLGIYFRFLGKGRAADAGSDGLRPPLRG